MRMLITKEIITRKVIFFNYKEAKQYAPQFKNKVIKSKKYQKYIQDTLNEYMSDIERVLERTGFKVEELNYIKDNNEIRGVLMEGCYKPVQIQRTLRELTGRVFEELIDKIEDLHTASDIYRVKKIKISKEEIRTYPYDTCDELYFYFENKILDILNTIKTIIQKALDMLLSDKWVAIWVVDNRVEVEIQTLKECEWWNHLLQR